jgi:hypothetical protein
MEADKTVDGRLLVASALSAPDVTYAALYSPAGEFNIYAIPATLLVSAAAGWILYESGASADTTLTVMGYVLVIAWWIKWLIVAAVFWYPAYKAWLLAGTWPGLSATHHLFTREGIEIVGSRGPSLLRWADVSRVVETKKGFLFYRQGKIAAFVPSRRLEGDAEISIVRKFIVRNVSDATLLA